MNGGVGLGFMFAICTAIVPATAFAGAWTLDAGTGQAIVTATPSQANKAFDGSGNMQSIPRYSKAEVQALFEYGATDAFTVMFSPSLQHIDIASPFEAGRTGLGYTDIGGRMRLLQANSWVFSVQSTLRVPGTFEKSNPAAIGYTDFQLDVRGLLGYSFDADGWPAFVDIQAGQRFRSAGAPDEFRADITFGVYPYARWLLLAQSFNVTSEGAGNGRNASYGYYKFQLSAAYAVTPSLSLQFGGFSTYWGRNALQENGLVLGASYKF
jgi:hypothetical protein